MTDALSTLKKTREHLSHGLQILQTQNNLPGDILEQVASPIAEAMGMIHQMQDGCSIEQVQAAMHQVRVALTQLQTHSQPTTLDALESVAQALGLLHELVRTSEAPSPITSPPPPPAPVQRVQPTPATTMEAALGTHSPTNFYKGLAGNDIVEHGGLFISTYKIPKEGTQLFLKVSLPGGYEFEAHAIVKWVRSASESNGYESPPGFGAQFTQVSQEARQLIYRYTRNREPLFHDDF